MSRLIIISILFFTSLTAFVVCNPHKKPNTVLHYLVRSPKIKTEHPPIVILLHGIGSNEKDLFSFAGSFPDKYLVVSARAPYPLGNDGYAWYHADFSKDPAVIDTAEAEQSRKTIIELVGELKSVYAFDEKQVYLCGFSQGSIMSYSVGLTRPDLIKGIALMSGRMLEEVKPKIDTTANFKSMRVFMSHGTNDPVLNVKYARAGRAYLQQLHIEPTYKEYPEGHTISPEMLRDLLEWLK